jgi:hypothetical protein
MGSSLGGLVSLRYFKNKVFEKQEFSVLHFGSR